MKSKLFSGVVSLICLFGGALASSGVYANAAAVLMSAKGRPPSVVSPIADFDSFLEISGWFNKSYPDGTFEMRICDGGVYRTEHNACIKPTLRKDSNIVTLPDLSINEYIAKRFGGKFDVVGKSLVGKYNRSSSDYFNLLVYLKRNNSIDPQRDHLELCIKEKCK